MCYIVEVHHTSSKSCALGRCVQVEDDVETIVLSALLSALSFPRISEFSEFHMNCIYFLFSAAK
jgi:hypothetical protein